MREILFRGFHECEKGTHKAYYGEKWHKGEWVYGAYFYLHHNDKRDHIHHFIIPENTPLPKDKPIGEIQIEVAPETVCQYTGLDDKNGKKIFKYDICNNGSYNDIVIWRNFGYHCDSLAMHDKWLEVIGNKFENPELLEVEE